jgi:putative colanic acid biosynthesis UDP-glucose lipid carrier transferase
VGFYDDRVALERRGFAEAVAPFLGCTRTLVEHARQGRVDTVYIALPLQAEPRINALLHLLADTTASVHVVAEFSIYRPRHGCWASVADVPVLRIFDTPFSGVGAQVKRLEDLVLSAATLSVLCIPLLLIALMIKLSSRGTVFSKQRRLDFNGSQIDCLTFRTRESSNGVEASRGSADAPPSIRLGRWPLGEFLRNTSLDEVPQLLNVFLGGLSIVGPSLFPTAPSEQFGAEIQGYLSRHRVKPGLTGWAQVNLEGCDRAENANLRAQHDLDYIRNWSLLWDFEIMLRAMFGSGNQRTPLEGERDVQAWDDRTLCDATVTSSARLYAKSLRRVQARTRAPERLGRTKKPAQI